MEHLMFLHVLFSCGIEVTVLLYKCKLIYKTLNLRERDVFLFQYNLDCIVKFNYRDNMLIQP